MKRITHILTLLLLLAPTVAPAQSQVTHIEMLGCGLALNEIFNGFYVDAPEKEIAYGGIAVTRHWTSFPAAQHDATAVGYLAGSIQATTTTGYAQLQYSPDGGVTWLDCPQTLSLAAPGDHTGNIAPIPFDLVHRSPILLRLVTKGGAPEQVAFPLAIDLVLMN